MTTFIIKQEIELAEFKAWSGAVSVLEQIIELDIMEEASAYIIECLGNEFTDTELNDLLWFDMDDFIQDYEEENE